MVEVGDKVIVAPLDGQKDKMVIVTGPAGAGAVLNEGDYNTWTKEWINTPSNGIYDISATDVLIDERNNVLSIIWRDNGYENRFGIYNLADFSVVFESPLGSNYVYDYPNTTVNAAVTLGGIAYTDNGGASRSVQTYLLLTRADEYTIEVWRGGASALWSRNTRTDFGTNCYCYAAGITLTGKYILAMIHNLVSPYDDYLMLYKGSSV